MALASSRTVHACCNIRRFPIQHAVPCPWLLPRTKELTEACNIAIEGLEEEEVVAAAVEVGNGQGLGHGGDSNPHRQPEVSLRTPFGIDSHNAAFKTLKAACFVCLCVHANGLLALPPHHPGSFARTCQGHVAFAPLFSRKPPLFSLHPDLCDTQSIWAPSTRCTSQHHRTTTFSFSANPLTKPPSPLSSLLPLHHSPSTQFPRASSTEPPPLRPAPLLCPPLGARRHPRPTRHPHLEAAAPPPPPPPPRGEASARPLRSCSAPSGESFECRLTRAGGETWRGCSRG